MSRTTLRVLRPDPVFKTFGVVTVCMMNPSFRETFHDCIDDATRIMITGHVGPDPDSIGSVMGMYRYLVDNTSHTLDSVDIVYEAERSDQWAAFEAYNTINFVDDLTAETAMYDCFIFLDANEPSRFTSSGRPLGTDGPTICIDHHPTDEYRFDHNWVDDSRASASDMVCELCYDNAEVSKEVAEYLLFGIIGDTGMFRYVKPENAAVLGIAEKLVREGGIHVERLSQKTGGVDPDAFTVFQELMANATVAEVDGWPSLLYSYVDEDTVRETTDEERSSGSHMFVSWTKRIDDVSWGFVLTPRSEGKIAASFRSTPGSVNVKDVAERMDIGGGHVRAAGGRFEDITAEEAADATLDWMEDTEPELE